MMATPLFMPLFWVAMIGNLVLFFVAQNVAMKGNNATALPLLSVYSLITGFTLSGLVAMPFRWLVLPLPIPMPVWCRRHRGTGHGNHLRDCVDRRKPHERQPLVRPSPGLWASD